MAGIQPMLGMGEGRGRSRVDKEALSFTSQDRIPRRHQRLPRLFQRVCADNTGRFGGSELINCHWRRFADQEM